MTLIPRSLYRLLLYTSLLLSAGITKATTAHAHILTGSDVISDANRNHQLLTSCESDLESRSCLYCLTTYGQSIMLDCCSNLVTLHLCVDFIKNTPIEDDTKTIPSENSGTNRRFSDDKDSKLSPHVESSFDGNELVMRPKHFLLKRDEEFPGDPTYEDMISNSDEMKKRAKYFLGKRSDYQILSGEKSVSNKRARSKYFLGKRQDDPYLDMEKRARSKYFLGKREDDQFYDGEKRAKSKYFLGKRSFNVISDDDKRAKSKYFLGKRQERFAGDEFVISKEKLVPGVTNNSKKNESHRLRKRSALEDEEYDDFEDKRGVKRVRQKYFLGKRGQKFFLGRRSGFDLRQSLRTHPSFERIGSSYDEEEPSILDSSNDVISDGDWPSSSDDRLDFQEIHEMEKRAPSKSVLRSARRGKYFLG